MADNISSPYLFVESGSLAADYTGPVIDIRLQDNVGIQLNWTGDAVGTFYPEVTLDLVTWIPITLTPAVEAAGVADSAYMDLTQLSAPYVRVTFVWTSGSGSLTGYATAKGI